MLDAPQSQSSDLALPAEGAPAQPATPAGPYNELWRSIQARIHAACKAMDEAREAVSDAAEDLGLANVHGLQEVDALAACEKAREQILAAMIARASRRFTQPGLPLTIRKDELWGLGPAAGHWAPDWRRDEAESREEREARINAAFDPDAVWAWIEKTYGGQAGKEAARAQLAKHLDDVFLLTYRPPKRRSGCLVLRLDARQSRHGKGYDIDTTHRIALAAHRLSEVAVFAGEHEAARALRPTPAWSDHWVPGRDRDIQAHEKTTLGCVTFVTFSGRVDVLVGAPLAEHVQLVVAKYLPAG